MFELHKYAVVYFQFNIMQAAVPLLTTKFSQLKQINL